MAKKKSGKKGNKKKDIKKKKLKKKGARKKELKKKSSKKISKKKTSKKKATKKKTSKKKATKKKASKKKEAKKKEPKKKSGEVLNEKESVAETTQQPEAKKIAVPDHSSKYNVSDAVRKLRLLKSIDELLAFTKGEKRLTITKAIPAVKNRLQS